MPPWPEEGDQAVLRMVCSVSTFFVSNAGAVVPETCVPPWPDEGDQAVRRMVRSVSTFFVSNAGAVVPETAGTAGNASGPALLFRRFLFLRAHRQLATRHSHSHVPSARSVFPMLLPVVVVPSLVVETAETDWHGWLLLLLLVHRRLLLVHGRLLLLHGRLRLLPGKGRPHPHVLEFQRW